LAMASLLLAMLWYYSYMMLIYLNRWAFPIGAVLFFLAFYWRCLGGRRGIARSLLPLYNGSYRSSSRTRTDWSLKLHAQTHH
jgi:hypothetical protein